MHAPGSTPELGLESPGRGVRLTLVALVFTTVPELMLTIPLAGLTAKSHSLDRRKDSSPHSTNSWLVSRGLLVFLYLPNFLLLLQSLPHLQTTCAVINLISKVNLFVVS